MTGMTQALLKYLRFAWTMPAPIGTANIVWSEDWWQSRYPDKPQISITDVTNPVLERYTTHGSMDFKYNPIYSVNVWQQIPRGANGTQEFVNIENMRNEVARIFREGFLGTAPTGYGGGSVGPLLHCLPLDAGKPRHELDKEPRLLRYEITLKGASDYEPNKVFDPADYASGFG